MHCTAPIERLIYGRLYYSRKPEVLIIFLSLQIPMSSKAEIALPIKPHSRNLERQWATPIFCRTSGWRTRTGSSNNSESQW